MLLGALIWIATLVPYFVVYSDRKYKAMTRYQIHVYLTSDNQRPRSEGEFQASDPRSKRPCCNACVLRKFRVIKGRNAVFRLRVIDGLSACQFQVQVIETTKIQEERRRKCFFNISKIVTLSRCRMSRNFEPTLFRLLPRKNSSLPVWRYGFRRLSLAAGDILFLQHDEDVFKCCVSPV